MFCLLLPCFVPLKTFFSFNLCYFASSVFFVCCKCDFCNHFFLAFGNGGGFNLDCQVFLLGFWKCNDLLQSVMHSDIICIFKNIYTPQYTCILFVSVKVQNIMSFSLNFLLFIIDGVNVNRYCCKVALVYIP